MSLYIQQREERHLTIMPPKKKGPAKKPSASAAGEITPGEDPKVVLSNYTKFCKAINITPSSQVVKTFQNEESATNWPVTQLIVDNDFGPFPAGSARALATAIMGCGPGMVGGPYKLLSTIRIWRCQLGNEATAAMVGGVAEIRGAEVKIEYLELFDDGIGPEGAAAIGRALSYGNNRTLLNLKLDYNGLMGAEGVNLLCRGLRTNSSLKQLHLAYCGITYEAGHALGEVLSYARSALKTLNLMGNRLGGQGLSDLGVGLGRSKSLTYLSLADNGINSDAIDQQALTALASAMTTCESLAHIDLLYNRIGEEGANILLPSITPDNTRIKTFLVDSTLPTALFEALHRKESGGRKKGGAKKGGGKRKKK